MNSSANFNFTIGNDSLQTQNNTNGSLIGYTGTSDPFAVYYSWMFLLGALLAAMSYGSVIALFLGILPSAVMGTPVSGSTRRIRPYHTLIYIVVLFVFNTVFVVTTIIGMKNAYVENVAYPGGLLAYSADILDQAVTIVNQVSFVSGSLLADVFLLLRAHAIFKAVGGKGYQLLLLPAILMLLVSTALSFMYSAYMINPMAIFGDPAINWASIYFTASFVENAYLTILITLRIFIRQRRSHRRPPTDDRYAQMGATLYTMFIESAALYSVVALGAVVTFDNPMNMVWVNLSLPVQTCASFLITYRIAQGRSWDADNARESRDLLQSKPWMDEEAKIDGFDTMRSRETWV